MIGLDLEQLPNQEVVIDVGDLRAIEDVISLVVVGDLPAELRGANGWLDGLAHGCECKQLGTE